jgi:lipopolysaccharide biosynthesis glycosyltransferase
LKGGRIQRLFARCIVDSRVVPIHSAECHVNAMAFQEKPPDEDPVVLVAGADERFALGLTVTLSSALRHLDHSRRAHVFVLDGGLTPGSRERCRASLARAHPKAETIFISELSNRFSGLHVHSYSRAAFLRLLIPEIVPDGFDRVLYLDSDLVVRGDVSLLWAFPAEGKAFWAAFDDGVRDTNFVRDRLGFAGVPEDAPYFNSGVLLIDLPRWRAARISERAEEFLAQHSKLCLEVDQDALNVVAVGNWSVLPPNWNFQVVGMKAWSVLPPGSDDTVNIVHFINKKPWSLGQRCLWQSAFDKALRESGWFSRRACWQYFLNRRIRSILALHPLAKATRLLRRRLRAA